MHPFRVGKRYQKHPLFVIQVGDIMNIKATLASMAATTFLLTAAPLAAVAQNDAAPAPSYASRGGETVNGTIASIDGKYNITVRDNRGYVDNVTLHDGTIINPTGLRLSPGQSVTIAGVASGHTFIANEIDTPYSTYGVPYAYYPYYPYPAFGVGFRFGGPRFGFRGRGRI
jgi:hypothetical protein